MNHLQRRLFHILWMEHPLGALSHGVNTFLLALILANVVAVAAETVQPWASRHTAALNALEIFSVAVFTLEYALRVWLAPLDPRYPGRIAGRLRFMLSPMALVDLAAILPFYLPFVAADLRSLRVLRTMRILRLLKLARYTRALRLMDAALHEVREQLLLALAVVAMLMVLVSAAMYHVEHEAQPDKFPHIPAALWWSVETVTTLGYGDIYPVTFLGRLLAGIVAILGVGTFALPAGIIGSGILRAMEEEKNHHAHPLVCPHCHTPIAPIAMTPIARQASDVEHKDANS